ncbi:MAG: 6-phosphofructokinase [Phycisphaerales bacterium]
MSDIKRIGILTGGGDCPGLNAVIRAVAKTAIFDHGWEVFGIRDGYLGLIEDRVRALSADDVSGILTVGGTILGTSNKANPARYCTGMDADGEPVWADVTDRCLATIERHGLDAIVAIGGDGTMAGAMPFVEAGVNVVGVPKTIDNDIPGTEISFGYLTAVDICTEALDRLHTTAASHSRVMIAEVMGRNAGWIALAAGIAGGADVILLPELPFDLGAIAEMVAHRARIGRSFTMVCVAEGARAADGERVVARRDESSPDPVRLGGIGHWLAGELERVAGAECRAAVLGHVQRGGSPCAADRVLATEFGHRATGLLSEGARNRMVVRRGGVVTDADLREVGAGGQRTVPLDHPLIAAARSVGTSFGVM